MIYPRSFESKIGFDTIKNQLYELCLTKGGKKLVSNISFNTDYEIVVQLISETEEMRQALLFHSGFHFSEYPECIWEIIQSGTEGVILEQQTLSNLKQELTVFEDCLTFFTENKSDFPLLSTLWYHQLETERIINSIDKIVDEKGEIRNNASARLAEIRSQIEREHKKADKQIALIMRAAKAQGIVKDDSEISIRDGRAVIPVPAANKRQLRGFVHDASATGQTLYIEPDEVFDINNQIRELQNTEKQEIIKILRNFTLELRPDIPHVIDMDNYLSYIDFLRAKALYAIDVMGVKPIVLDTTSIHLVRAKHPLLLQNLQKQNRKVVPQNIKLDNNNRILIISGPNAGGKSIALKTVALLQYMLQCGLLIPASENSEVGIFSDIFIDIGDEQSIENDLSTYTSHLLNMKFFIEHASESSLVFIDEIGSGTEPQLGGAIAESSLERLCELGAKGIVTTHYANIKRLASEKQGLFNGAMLFDKKEIKPLFQLSVGKPGSSYTFEIAKRVGFPQDILKQAAAKSEAVSQVNYEQLLEELDVERQKLMKEKEELNVADDFLKEIIDKYTKQLKQIEDSKKDIIKKAKADAADIVRNSNRLIENAIKEIREAQAEKARTKLIREKLEKELAQNVNEQVADEAQQSNLTFSNTKIPSKIRRKLDEINQNKARSEKQKLNDAKIDEINSDKDIKTNALKFEKLRNDFPEKEKLTKQQTNKSNAPLKVGSLVTIQGNDSVGEIIEIKGKDAKVQFDNMSMSLKLKDLQAFTGQKPKAKFVTMQTSVNNFVRELNERAYSFNINIDVRGMRADEALYELQKYLDDAIMYGIRSFSILHGRGNGILRKTIRQFLTTIPQVMFFGDESVQNGGDGITVVKLAYESDKYDETTE